MQKSERIKFLEFTIRKNKLMQEKTNRIAEIAENTLEGIFELAEESVDAIIEAENKDKMLRALVNLINNTVNQAEAQVQNRIMDYGSKLVMTAEEWLNSSGISSEQLGMVMAKMQYEVEANGYNVIYQDVAYYSRRIISIMSDTLTETDSTAILDKLRQLKDELE